MIERNNLSAVSLIIKTRKLKRLLIKIWIKVKLRPFIALIIAIAIFLLIALPFAYYFYSTQKEIQPIQAIPNDAALIFKINKIGQNWSKVEKSQVWRNYLQESQNNDINQKINLFLKLIIHNSGIAEVVKNNPLYISFHPMHDGNIGILFTFQTQHSITDSDINAIIRRYFGSNVQIVVESFSGVSYRKIFLKKEGQVINLVFRNGLLIATTNASLINAAIEKLKSGTEITSASSFSKVCQTENPKAAAVLYINYRNVSSLLNYHLKNDSYASFLNVSHFSDWTELDITINEKQILFNGFSAPGDSTNTFLNLFANQKAQPTQIDSILPSNTAALINIGFNDYQTIFRRLKIQLKQQGKLEIFEKQFRSISDSLNFNAEQTLTSWIKNEMGIAITYNPSLSEDENMYAYFKTNSPGVADASLAILAKKNTMVYNGTLIRMIGIPSFLPTYYGKLFPKFDKYYFAIIKDYVVFAHSVNALTAIISSFNAGKVLAASPVYQNFRNNVSGSSNVWIYADLPQILSHLSNLIAPTLVNKSHLIKLAKSAKLLTAEYALENKLFYTSICIATDTSANMASHNQPEDQYENKPVPDWSTILEGKASAGPIIFKTSKGKQIVLIDENNKIWSINEKGVVEWNHLTGGHIIGNPRIIDYQGRNVIAFNSNDLLYLLDENGEYVKDYPMRLPITATNELVSFNGTREGLSFLIASSDNRLHAIGVIGKKLNSWSPPQMKGPIRKPVQIIESNGRKLVVIKDEGGRIKIADAKGAVNGDFEKVPQLSSNTLVWANHTKSKGDIIAAAADGDLLFIKRDGTSYKLPFETIIKHPFFIFDQFDNNGKPNYIFADEARLTVFDQQCEIIYEFNTKSFPRFQPYIYIAPNNKKYYLITLTNGSLAFFGPQGVLKDFPIITSDTPPCILPLSGKNNTLIITTENKIIRAYRYNIK